MIERLPQWVNVLFILTTIVTIVFFYFSNGKPLKLTVIIILWSIVHAVLAYSGYYLVTDTAIPRFGLVLIPITMLIIYSLLPRQRDMVLQARNLKISTFLHVVRLPVEIVLFQLFVYQMIPKLMTFEGINYDILMGITAPIIGYLFVRHKLSEKGLILWNMLGLCLISGILLLGILSSELPIQQLAFDQPNRAVTYFPYILLPATIVPIVWWTHLTDILKLRQEIL